MKKKQCQGPIIIARYGEDYTITQGITHGLFYVFHRDIYIGMDSVYANAVSLISLRHGEGFDINKVQKVKRLEQLQNGDNNEILEH